MEGFLNIKSKIIEALTYEDLRQKKELQDIADIIGIEACKKLIEEYNGISIYIPKVTHFDAAVKRVVIEEKKMKSLMKISKELGMSLRTLKKRLDLWN